MPLSLDPIREAVAACEEAIATGSACPTCGADWHEPVPGTLVLDHELDCGFVAAREFEAIVQEAIEAVA